MSIIYWNFIIQETFNFFWLLDILPRTRPPKIFFSREKYFTKIIPFMFIFQMYFTFPPLEDLQICINWLKFL